MTGAAASTGRMIAVVGPSGVGKDSVMAGIVAAMPDISLVRRIITRAPGLGGEQYDAVSVSEFEEMKAAGQFALDWGAHGLHYALPRSVLVTLEQGQDCLANLSRKALPQAAVIFPHLKVLQITASPATLAKRLAVRGRETQAEIAARLAEAEKPLPDALDVTTLPNDGPLDATVSRAVAVLERVGV